MTDPLRLLQAGDRLNGISAAAWNAFVNAAKYVQQMQATGAAPALGNLIGPGQVFVLNNSGDDQDQYAVLQIDEALIAPADNQPGFASRVALSCVTPTANRKGSFVVLSRPIPAGEVGPAWIDGVCPARISGGGSWADTKNGETAYLEAGDYGNARIIADPTGGTSERWAYVRLNDSRRFILVQTVAGPDATPYPVEGDNPNVYRCQILSAASFTKAAGSQVLSYTPTGRYDHVMNLVDDHYIEEDSVLGALELDGQIYTMDKIRQAEIVIVGHTYGATSQGTGSLSRIKPADGSVIWTADLGSDTYSGTNRPRIPYSVSLDSRGNAYVYWLNAADSSGKLQGEIGPGHRQGVKKYSPNGDLLASYDIAITGAYTVGTNTFVSHGKVQVDPNHDDRIYVACDYNVDGKWLYRLDDNLVVTWSIGPAETAVGVTNRSRGLAVRSDGSMFVTNYPIASIGDITWLIDENGATVNSDSVFIGQGHFVDPSDRLRVPLNGLISLQVGAGYGIYPAAQFGKSYSDFPTPDTLGTWDAPLSAWGNCGYADGLHCVFGMQTQFSWNPASGPAQPAVNLFVTNADGTPVRSGWWGNGGTVTGLAKDTITGHVYCTGTGLSGGGFSASIVGKIDPINNTTDWTAPVLTSLVVDQGWTIAARTCRL